jgi:spermidine synthase
MYLLYLITFFSGFSALVYETLWIRQLSLILGSTTASISTVVAAFMGGLALGSGLLGRSVDRSRRPLRVYALIELGIGLSALLVMALLPVLQSIYPRLAAVVSSWGGLLALARFTVVFALLLLPASFMGGTFPVLIKAMALEAGSIGGTAGRLYGINTGGAVMGCFTTAIYLLGAAGLPGTYGVAVALNLIAAVMAWILDRHAMPAAALPLVPLPAQDPVSARHAVAWAIGISGCIALGYEIVWSRALAIVLGHSIYAFAFVLSTYLAGLTVGGLISAPWLDRLRRPAYAFALGLLVMAVISGISLYLIPVLPFREYDVGTSPLVYVFKNLACAAIVLLPPTLILGALLPLAVRVCTPDLAHAGKDVGYLYAYNTVGSIAGSLITGFLLVPWLGTQASFSLLVLANVALALVVGTRVGSHAALRLATLGLFVLSAVGLWTSGGSPIIRNKALARVERFLGTEVKLLYFGEDEVASVGLVQEPSGLKRLFVDGTLMTHWGLETIWMAHLPLAIVSDPHDVLVLCLGMGNTYVSAMRHPVRTEAVELSRRVVDAFYVLHGPQTNAGTRGRIVVGDARNEVLVAPRPFDVITVDPPPPLYSAGTVNFHTTEFYRLCLRQIRSGGVVCVWIPFHHCTVDEFKMLAKTFRAVFQRTQLWVPSPEMDVSGVYMIALGPEVRFVPEAVRDRLLAPAVEADVRRFTDRPLESVLPMLVLSDGDIDLFCGAAPLLDDDHPYLEFPLVRNAGRNVLMDFEPILRWLRARGRLKSGG